MRRRFLHSLRMPHLPAGVGNKARNLGFLLRHGFPVPEGFVCSPITCLNGDAAASAALRSELEAKLVPGRAYAVRSSAGMEDGASHSFAGQFQTLLNVTGTSEILAAIEEVCASIQSPAVQSYLTKTGRHDEPVLMSVIIQEMATPVFAGVAFSKNPVTGLSEVVVEAVEGSGERLVQDGVTPYRWVYASGTWRAKPENGKIPTEIAERVVEQTREIARIFGKPSDLEWVYDGKQLWWVQLRAITTIGAVNVYSDKMAREFLPGQIKPLVWSMNVQLINTAWVRIFSEILGKVDINPLNLTRQFHYRAYFNMKEIGRMLGTLGMPPDSLELMMGMLPEGAKKPAMKPSLLVLRHTGRALRFIWDKWHFDRRLESFLPEAKNWYDDFRKTDRSGLDEHGLLAEVDQLFQYTLDTAYFSLLVPMLMQIYNRLLMLSLKRSGVDFTRVDITSGLEGIDDIDPKTHIARLRTTLDGLDPQTRQKILESSARTLDAIPGAERFARDFSAFLKQFGHLSDSGVDFSYVPWREDPAHALEIISWFQPTPPPESRTAFEDLDIKRRRWTEMVFRRTRKYRLYREKISSLYTYGYGSFRDLFMPLGKRLADIGRLADASDIFYLYIAELRAAADDPRMDISRIVATRKAEMVACADVRLPGIIFGDNPPCVDKASGEVLRGVPTSSGRYSGPVCVIRNTGEFSRMRQGDVLVIPFSEVSWTPLFSKAGALVSESGGILSHSSIVAREYGIPAVVSVRGALELENGITVEVDGYTGEVVLQKERGA